jgi:hypothetical protein
MTNTLTLPGKHIVKGNVVAANYHHELHRNVEKVKHNGKTKYRTTAANLPQQDLDLDFLQAASETYQISPDPKDYIMVSLPIVTSDVPNRNMQGFMGQELAYFDAAYGCMVYQTFLRKPTHIDHYENTIPHKAKGVHVDASMVYVPKYDLWKINVLTMWDRTKDEKLVKEILDKKRTGYSMGASCAAFLCSICGRVDEMDHNSCEHMRPKGTLWGKENTLSYQVISAPVFFETSSVESPADPTAQSDDVFV